MVSPTSLITLLAPLPRLQVRGDIVNPNAVSRLEVGCRWWWRCQPLAGCRQRGALGPGAPAGKPPLAA